MIKIISIIGSPKPFDFSLNARIVAEIVSLLNRQLSMEHQMLLLHDCVISHCKGCENCFRTGQCSIVDEMSLIKSYLMEADIIIFASPVYVHNVTGIMKTFFDRLAYWTHLFPLVGKIGLTVSVSHNNGNTYVDTFLNEIMMHLGIIPVHNLSIQMGNITEAGLTSYIQNAARHLEKAQKNKDSLPIPDYLTTSYKYYYGRMMELNNMDKQSFHEYVFWNEHNYLKHVTFESLFKSRL